MHSFSDQSGCVFLDIHSGETLSILMSESEISKVLSGNTVLDKETSRNIAIQSLIQKNILVPIDSKKI
ncbi:hypothetical protein [uncultured Paraglaciecola sp.]|uniref:hypothetical protein n=1 Tax=uncultured Paraglaciecola sp. TaxID=1765024 RepID=UPI0025CFBB0D|nr:hypothetical protein [uncultured Paraglaciecola sp.]